jgi:hypothetical protein
MIKKMAITLMLFVATTSYGYDIKKVDAIKTKMKVFASKTGMIIKYVNTKLSNLKTPFGIAEARVRKSAMG